MARSFIYLAQPNKAALMNAVYESVIERLKGIGCRAEFHRPHQLVLGNRVWIMFNGQWFISTWTPAPYPVPPEVDIVELCEACLTVEASPFYEIPPDICRRFGISRMAWEDFEPMCLLPPDDELDEKE